ncbi:MAG: 5-oxoprolinase, partial [Myxococcales bacterium]|nr:5-oxoprolinase [Myxococcales bacterium]
MDSARRPRWQVWIDRGGTFTDCIGRDPGTGALRVVKVLSSDRAPIDGLRRLLELPDDAPIPPCDIRMGTTVATNALLTRGGAPTGLAITRGFGDLLEIGDQTRPDLFALAIEKPAPLPCAVVELDARAGPGGEALARPDPIALREQLGALRSAGAVSLAVVVLHAYTDEGARLEREVGAVARSLGFVHVALSHEVTGEQGIVGRGDTTVLDAYVTPPLGAHVNALLDAAVGSHLRLMQSSGDLIEASRFRGRDAILSGPAAGVVAVAELARRLGLPQVIGLDMGGTST